MSSFAGIQKIATRGPCRYHSGPHLQMPYNHPREIEKWNDLQREREERFDREADLYKRVGRGIDERRWLSQLGERVAEATPAEMEALRAELGSYDRRTKKRLKESKK